MIWSATFVLASMAVPFESGQLEPYVRELCQQARTMALPRDASSTTALQSLAVCFLVHSDMVHAGQPARDCDAVVSMLRPDDPGAATAVCKTAGMLTRSWASGRF